MIELDPTLVFLAVPIVWGFWAVCVLRDLRADQRELAEARRRVEARS